MSSLSLEGRVAIITGASRGIGQGIAEAYAQAGAKLVLCSRSLDRVQPVAEAIQAEGGQAVAVACHTGDDGQVRALVQTALNHYGRLDIAVNNAGTNPHFGPVLFADDAVWLKTLDTNLLGYMRLIRHAVPAFEKSGGGKIVNVASVAGINPMPGIGLYGVTKAAVIMLTKTMAIELAHANIQVNAIAPGVIKTRFAKLLYETPEIADTVLKTTPAKRFGEVDDVVGAAVYLGSPASDYTTGTVMIVDGGGHLTSFSV